MLMAGAVSIHLLLERPSFGTQEALEDAIASIYSWTQFSERIPSGTDRSRRGSTVWTAVAAGFVGEPSGFYDR
jgi:hypothetical protein